MSFFFNLKTFEKTIGFVITIKRGIIFPSGDRMDLYTQGILRKVNIEKDTIEVEEYLSLMDFLNGDNSIPSKKSEIKNGEFELVSNVRP